MGILQTIAGNVRLAREQAGMTQEELARQLGLASHSGVSDIESGNRRVSATDLGTLAEVLGRSIDWFFDPNATREDFVALARATEAPAAARDALTQAQRLFENYLVLERILQS